MKTGNLFIAVLLMSQIQHRCAGQGQMWAKWLGKGNGFEVTAKDYKRNDGFHPESARLMP
jgi:hypothetical protein